MIKSILLVTLGAIATAIPAAALAQGSQQSLCNTDNLAPAEAVQRLEWARKCGLLRNSGGPDSWFFTDAAFDVATITTPEPRAKDYTEINHDRAFTGNTGNYEVNYFYGWARYNVPAYTVFRETSGPTVNYYKWSHTVERPRPMYPTFETEPVAGTGIPLVPLPSVFDDCNLYQWDRTAGTLTPWRGNFYVVAYCESSCYTPDQTLRFSDGDVSIVEAMKARRNDLVTLSPDATLDDLTTQTSKVLRYTATVRDAEHVIYQITTASGGSLSVTNEHPMVTSEGRLVQAEKLRVGDELLKADGSPDPIATIEKTTHFGKVYNLTPTSREPVTNVLIAQGYLVGSARFQNDDVGYMNRILLFRAVPLALVPR